MFDIIPPLCHTLAGVSLERLEEHHNERDLAAWMGSIDHIRSTPGFEPGAWGDDEWPRPMSLEENLVDLADHHREFDQQIGFAYSVLRGQRIIGCVYIDVDETGAAQAKVRSWVVADEHALDVPLAVALRDWLHTWPFTSIRYVGRPNRSHPAS